MGALHAQGWWLGQWRWPRGITLRFRTEFSTPLDDFGVVSIDLPEGRLEEPSGLVSDYFLTDDYYNRVKNGKVMHKFTEQDGRHLIFQLQGRITTSISKRAYVPDQVSWTLDNTYYDWCVGRLAEYLGKNEDVKLFRARARGALAKYRAALDLDPTGFGFRLNHALALCRLPRWRDGVVELGEVLRLDPDNADAAKALCIAREQAKAQPGDIRKRP